MDDGGVNHLCGLLQAVAFEYDAAGGGGVDNAEANVSSSSNGGFALSDSLLSDLHGFFLLTGDRPSETAGLWEELAEKSISASGIVRMLAGSMDRGGSSGMKAAEVYLSLLLTPNCPVYSLYNQMAFDSFARCLRNCCKPSSSGPDSGAGDRGKKGQRKGKRTRDKGKQAMPSDDCDIDESQNATPTEPAEVVSVEDVTSVLVKLQRTVLVLNLKDRPETLKVIVELLVDMLHLLSDMKEDESGRVKKRLTNPSSRVRVPDIVFSTLEGMLKLSHGQTVTTAILVLRALTPTILLTHSSGSGNPDFSTRSVQFVVRILSKAEFAPIRPAVVALPRYLCFKAPEKTDARSLCVDSVTALLRASNTEELCKFTFFVFKFSHSKPRHRLVAVDVSLSLLGGLPSPLERSSLDGLGLNSSPQFGLAHDLDLPSGSGENLGSRDSHQDSEETAGIHVDSDDEAEGNTNVRVNPQEKVNQQQQGDGPGNVNSPERQWWAITCFEILLHRCSDKVPAIRARSLTNLAQAIELLSGDARSRRHLQTLLGFTGSMTYAAGKSNVGVPKSSIFGSCDTPIIGGVTPSPEPSADLPGATPLTPGAGHRDLWSLLQRRCVDDKAAVRKSALLLMKKSVALSGKAPDDEILHAMGTACGDSLISIRKAALGAVSEVLRRFPGDVRVAKEWLKSALPLAFDNEQTLQDECLSLFEELVLDRIALISTLKLPRSKLADPSSGGEASGCEDRQLMQEIESLLPVGTMILLKEIADGSSNSSCVKRICSNLGKRRRLRPGIALALQSLISAHRSPDGAWFLLSEVTAFVPKAVGWDFLRTHWQLLDKSKDAEEQQNHTEACNASSPLGESATWAVNRVHLLQTISNVAIELPADAAADLATELLDRLKAFNMHPAEVGAHIKALAILCKRKAQSTQADQLVISWVKELLEQAGKIIQAYIASSFSNNMDDTVNNDVFETPKMNSGTGGGTYQTRSMSKQSHRKTNTVEKLNDKWTGSPSQIVTVVFTVGALALACPQVKPGPVVTLLQTLLTPSRGLLGSRKGRGVNLKERITPEIHVHAWVALGKLSLADDALAKRIIPLFVQELGRTSSAAVRNNIAIIMTDFCVRYTALIDGYIHDLTRSMRDSCELVRRQAFVLLSRLLQRDYVKWRGMLFHRFLLALVDDSEKISQLARFVFGNVLKLKAPLLAYNSFVEAVFVLNDCSSQASSSPLLQIPESDRTLFSLRGDAQVEKRIKIYSTLLQQMAPEHLLATSAKLCAEILAAAADGLLDLQDGPSQGVLKDALRILALKELRISTTRASAASAELEEEEGGAAAAMAAVKRGVVTQLMKKNLVQNMVPVFIELKRLLEGRNSPVLGLLMECMRVMLKDYKSEIEEILVADKQLQKEILYDMQKHEAAKARAKVAAAIPILSPGSIRTPGAVRTPSSGLRPPAGAEVLQDSNKSGNDNAQPQAGRKSSGKENEIPSPNLNPSSHVQSKLKGAMTHSEITKTPSFSSLRKSNLGNFPSGDESRQDGSARTVIRSAIPGSVSRLQVGDSPSVFTPHPQTSKFRQIPRTPRPPMDPSRQVPITPHPFTNTFRQVPMTPRVPMDPPDPLCSSQVEETCLAGAVAEVAAQATVASVLHQVAQNSVTPFQAMSLPRLRPSVSAMSGLRPPMSAMDTLKKSEIMQDERTPPELLSQSVFGGDSDLETVRRRQSFSSVIEPCGLPSQ